MAEKIITVILMIPIYILLIWTYYFPEDSMLLGRKWMYKEEPEFSKSVIRYAKFGSLIGIVCLTLLLISIIFEFYTILNILALVLPIIFIILLIKIS